MGSKNNFKIIGFSAISACLLAFPAFACLEGECEASCFDPGMSSLVLYFIRIILFAIVLSLAVITAYNVYLGTKHTKNVNKAKLYQTRIKSAMVLFFIMLSVLVVTELIVRFTSKDGVPAGVREKGNQNMEILHYTDKSYLPPATEWVKAVFPEDYKTPGLDFWLPANWQWSCCNDMDIASVHTIYPNATDEYVSGDAIIKISDYSLRDCPAANTNCSIDKTVNYSPSDKFRIMMDRFEEQYTYVGTSTLKNTDIDAEIFRTEDKKNNNRLFFLANTGTNVISIEFYRPEIFNPNTIELFLNKIVK